MLVDNCLNHMIFSDVVHECLQFAISLVDQSEEIYSSLMASETTSGNFEASDMLGKIKLELDKRKSELQASSKTYYG